jgi:RimJ/RimL family protein N-acetyltransferase
MNSSEVAPQGVTFRVARPEDIEVICDIFSRSRAAALPFLPLLHSREEDLAFFSGYLRTGMVTLALREAPLGFLAETQGWVDHLYLDPLQRGQGMGAALIRLAMTRQEKLQLWCFADNHPARRFYERLGFLQIGGTSGDNEEGLPDILYEWRRQPAAPSS